VSDTSRQNIESGKHHHNPDILVLSDHPYAFLAWLLEGGGNMNQMVPRIASKQ
jgi:hypothetical protein